MPAPATKPTFVQLSVFSFPFSTPLNNATLPFVLALAGKGAKQAMLDDPHLLEGLNVHRGMVTYDDVAEDLGYEYVPALKALEVA